jgi:allantoin racemase
MRIVYIIPGPMSRTELGAAEVTRRGAKLREWAAQRSDVDIRDVERGPASIESMYEEYLSIPATAEAMLAAEREGYDAALLGCFGDPGVHAYRELLTRMVVVAPGEAAFHLAGMLGDRFGIVTITSSVIVPMRHLVAECGLGSSLAGIEVVETPVLELARDHEQTLGRMRDAGRRLIEQGADALVLGCMSMAFMDVTGQLEDELGVPVVNPARSALKMAEAIVGSRLRHSKKAYPLPPKLVSGAAADPAALVIG